MLKRRSCNVLLFLASRDVLFALWFVFAWLLLDFADFSWTLWCVWCDCFILWGILDSCSPQGKSVGSYSWVWEWELNHDDSQHSGYTSSTFVLTHQSQWEISKQLYFLLWLLDKNIVSRKVWVHALKKFSAEQPSTFGRQPKSTHTLTFRSEGYYTILLGDAKTFERNFCWHRKKLGKNKLKKFSRQFCQFDRIYARREHEYSLPKNRRVSSKACRHK